MTLVNSFQRALVFGLAVIIALLVVAVGWNREADAQSETATATATPAPGAAMAPTNTSSGGIDNGLGGTGLGSINCSAGSGLTQNNLILLAVNILGTGVIVTPPAGRVWVQIGTTITLNGDSEQKFFWHQVGSAEVGGPSFVFGISPSTRASCVAAAYKNTCLDSPNGCPNGNPIFDSTVGTSVQSSFVSQMVSLYTTSQSGQISFPDDSLVVGVFGTTNTNSSFGISATNPPFVNGVPGRNQTGIPLNMSLVNSVSGLNGGLIIANLTEPFAGTDGPWQATLPQLGNFPTTKITTISSDGTIVTVTGQNLPNLYEQPYFQAIVANVIGGSPPGCFNGTFTVTYIGSAMFTYTAPGGCIGTGVPSSGTITIVDPGIGDNFSGVVSILPKTQ
jgi:hypothetical protein